MTTTPHKPGDIRFNAANEVEVFDGTEWVEYRSLPEGEPSTFRSGDEPDE